MNKKSAFVFNFSLSKILLAAYVLIILAVSASVRAAQSIEPVYRSGQVKTSTYVGEIALSTDGQSYLILDNGRYFKLAFEAEMNVSDFNGQRVEVVGFELKHTVQPVVELMSMDPLLDGEQEVRVEPVLVVLKISDLL